MLRALVRDVKIQLNLEMAGVSVMDVYPGVHSIVLLNSMKMDVVFVATAVFRRENHALHCVIVHASQKRDFGVFKMITKDRISIFGNL